MMMNSRSSRIVAMARHIFEKGEEAQINNDTDINAKNKENIDSNNTAPSNQEEFCFENLILEPINVENIKVIQDTIDEITTVPIESNIIAENNNLTSVLTFPLTEDIPLHEVIDHNVEAKQTSTESNNSLECLCLQPSSEGIFQYNTPLTISNDVNEKLMDYESPCIDNFSDKDPDYRSSDESSNSSDSSDSSDSSFSDSTLNCSGSYQHSLTNAETPRNNENILSSLTKEIPTNEVNDIAVEPISNLQNDEVPQTSPKRGKKRIAKPMEWKKNQSKMLRNSGQEYISSSKTQKKIKAREMKPPCGLKCRLKCTTNINEEQRKTIFTNYWALKDILKQRTFIATSMQSIIPKYRYPSLHARSLNNSFHFQCNGQRFRVCKLFFKNTLDINDRPIRTVSKMKDSGFIKDDTRGKHGNHKTVDPEIKADMRRHIDSIPKIESHYLRAQTERDFIEGGKSLTDIFEDYKANCISQNRPYGNRVLFSRIFNREFNISFFSPKKDQCDLCTAFEIAKDDEKDSLKERYDQHQQEKILSRKEKAEDKEKVGEHFIVACYDLQAVLPCPKGEVSTFYYISKLNTYNFTICELKSDITKCYVWHEGEGKRGSNEIGTCVFKFIEEKARAINSDELELVFYSDNCCGQQKNRFIISMYMHAAQIFKVKSITHKFLIKGHSQNEGDNVHSIIERKIKKAIKSGPIYVPDQYITLIRTARRTHPYDVVEMSHDQFLDMKDLSSHYGTNFSKDVSNNVILMNDIKIVKVQKCSPFSFFCKTSYADVDYKEVCVKRTKRSRTTNSAINVKPLYATKIRIDEKKKRGFLNLFGKDKNSKTNNIVIPAYYYDYYNNL